MRFRRSKGMRAIVWGAPALALVLAACGQGSQQAAGPEIVETNFTLTPATAPVMASFLTGELKDMKVTQRVEKVSGKVVDPPKLSATLKLKNTSEDRAARLLSGKIEYVDADGNAIPLAQGRDDIGFKFYSYQMDRLDPGMDTTQTLEVPFPAVALKGKKLNDIRLELSYIPTPYEEETVSIPVSLSK